MIESIEGDEVAYVSRITKRYEAEQRTLSEMEAFKTASRYPSRQSKPGSPVRIVQPAMYQETIQHTYLSDDKSEDLNKPEADTSESLLIDFNLDVVFKDHA